MQVGRNNGEGQFKLIFQVEGNTFRRIFFGYFISDGLLYNFAATVTQRNCLADFIRLKLNFSPKNRKKSVFEPPFWGLRGNVRTPSIDRWKTRGRFPIHRN